MRTFRVGYRPKTRSKRVAGHRQPCDRRRHALGASEWWRRRRQNPHGRHRRARNLPDLWQRITRRPGDPCIASDRQRACAQPRRLRPRAGAHPVATRRHWRMDGQPGPRLGAPLQALQKRIRRAGSAGQGRPARALRRLKRAGPHRVSQAPWVLPFWNSAQHFEVDVLAYLKRWPAIYRNTPHKKDPATPGSHSTPSSAHRASAASRPATCPRH